MKSAPVTSPPVSASNVTTGGQATRAPIITLERMVFPGARDLPNTSEPQTKADQEKWASPLSRLAAEDPSFRVPDESRARPSSPASMGTWRSSSTA